MSKTILFYHDWPNTTGNHAGMVYFVRNLRRIRSSLRLLHTPKGYKHWIPRMRRIWFFLVSVWCRMTMGQNDVAFFMEYLGGRQCGDHREIALKLQRSKAKCRRIGLVHLSISHMRKLYSDDYIKEGLKVLDEIIVLGSALQYDLQKLVPNVPIHRILYYVDTDYYKPIGKQLNNVPIRCIAMGFLQRDVERLKHIVEVCPAIIFDVCVSNREDLYRIFENKPNVVCHRFLPEDDLLNLMQQADMSISVLEDCVGNNVVVTSMACGLPQIVSDVGSIRDYLSDETAILCKTDDDFINALNRLAKSADLREKMGETARLRAEDISLSKSIEEFTELLKSKT